VNAIGGFVEIVAWCVAWSIGATVLALSRFNDPAARLGGVPGRVWAALSVVWLWPFAFVAWFQAAWVIWPLLGIGPVGMLFVLALCLRRRRTTL
jgi:hypothetical protein